MNFFKKILLRSILAGLIALAFILILPEFQSTVELFLALAVGLICGVELKYGNLITNRGPKFLQLLLILMFIIIIGVIPSVLMGIYPIGFFVFGL